MDNDSDDDHIDDDNNDDDDSDGDQIMFIVCTYGQTVVGLFV